MSLNIKTAQGLKRINTVHVAKPQEKVLKKDVNFYDYDGTLVTSYTKTEFLSLSAMPDNPSHDGLTAQGWNWSLNDAKTYVTANGKLDVGQTYITNDGKTRLYISLHEGRLSPQLGLGINGSVDVDWGDDSEHEIITGDSVSTAVYKEHKYAQEGDYVIALTVMGNASIIGSSSCSYLLNKVSGNSNTNKTYLNTLNKIEVGSNVSIGGNAFQNCYSLTSVTIPNTVTSIDNYAFQGCLSLASVTIPSTVTSIDTDAFSGCQSLASVTIPSTVTSIGGGAFYYCHSLTSVTIPSTVTSIDSCTFQNCLSLASVTIPNTVTNISNYAFSGCHSLVSVTIPSEVTNIGHDAFRYCHALTSVTIPSTVTSIDTYAFQYCYSLVSVTISSGVTSIGDYAFQYCPSLISVTIPSTVTRIGNYAFGHCYGFGLINILPTSAPAVSNVNAWLGVPSDCVIFIPYANPRVYLNSSQYPNPADYKYMGYNTYESGATLPTVSEDTLYNYTWYATLDDAKAQTNPISVGTGNKIYCRFTVV